MTLDLRSCILSRLPRLKSTECGTTRADLCPLVRHKAFETLICKDDKTNINELFERLLLTESRPSENIILSSILLFEKQKL
jgi:hypothetical protein